MPISPFPSGYRGSGILLHIISLPSPYGIGDFGPSAYQWIDLLAEAGQTWWQVLPLGPTGFGNCPYQPLTTFGANPLLISPDLLVADGLLDPTDVPAPVESGDVVNYEAVTELKRRLIELAWQRFLVHATPDLQQAYVQFRVQQQTWLDDFALFECLRTRYQTGCFWKWPPEVAAREPAVLDRLRQEYRDAIDTVGFGQFLAFRQIAQLKRYAHSKGLQLIGDLPFFVSPESSDVWANPELFLLDEQFRPQFVAGVPPDYFSPNGQLWGNPVYDWEALRRTGYAWWLRRIRSLLMHVDVIRLDHFRAFAAAWHVPVDAESALSGQWRPGPAADFFRAVQVELFELPFLAEDLGEITADVTALRDEFQLTGMRVLQFAFDGRPDNAFLPHNYDHNAVAYTATHDNDTSRGWFEALDDAESQQVRIYLQQPALATQRVALEMIHAIWSSAAALAIAPLQDLLSLSSEHRMNVPGKAEGNWGWRCTPEMLSTPHFQWLRNLTIQTHRHPWK